jgi:antitoxin PrlF
VSKKQKTSESCEGCCYQVSAVMTVDARGQTVLPKDIREKMGIRAGDKLALIVHESGGQPCCLSLVRANDLSRMVSGPLALVIEGGDVK